MSGVLEITSIKENWQNSDIIDNPLLILYAKRVYNFHKSKEKINLILHNQEEENNGV